jgi:hypothetical protein
MSWRSAQWPPDVGTAAIRLHRSAIRRRSVALFMNPPLSWLIRRADPRGPRRSWPVSAMGNAGGFGQQANNLIASPAIGGSDLALIGRKTDHLPDRKLVCWHAFKTPPETPRPGSTPPLPRVPLARSGELTQPPPLPHPRHPPARATRFAALGDRRGFFFPKGRECKRPGARAGRLLSAQARWQAVRVPQPVA